MDVVDAYNRWCKKMRPDTRGGRLKESIKVSCPNPAHPDKHPSAWLNREKNVYYCSGCAQGGDVWDMAAWHFGYNVPHYKNDPSQFRELRERIGVELGFVKSITGAIIAPVLEAPVTIPVPVQTPENVRVLPSAVEQQVEQEEREEKQSNIPVIDWRTIVPEQTFLRAWLDATTLDDCPEEYHFWTGLMSIGFAVGRNRTLQDTRPVVPNLFVCFVGPSGAGKSSAKSYLHRVVQEVMPYEYDNPLSTGTKHISSPGSAEYVVRAFSAPIPDPAFPKKILGYASVRAQVDFDELATLVTMGNRVGSTMKPQLIEIYDASQTIGSGSLTHGERVAHLPFGQVTSSTQDGSLRNLLGRSDEVSGFMNRWVFASGKLKRQHSIGGTIVDLSSAAGMLKDIHRWADTSKMIALTDSGFKQWDDFFHETLVPTKRMMELSGSPLLNRIDLLYKKLLVLFACNLQTLEVDANIVDQAIALFPYLLRTYGVVKEEISDTPENQLEERVIAIVAKHYKANQKAPSVRDIHQSIRRSANTKQVLEIVKNLVIIGRLRELVQPAANSGGRPTVRYVVSE
jgi:hypothetical protein